MSTAGKRGFGEFKRSLAPSLRDYLLRRSGRFVEIEGDTMVFNIDRVRLDEATFSAEALDGLADQFRFWLWSRVAREYEKTDWKVPPKHLTVVVAVNMSDKPAPVSGGEAFDASDWAGERT